MFALSKAADNRKYIAVNALTPSQNPEEQVCVSGVYDCLKVSNSILKRRVNVAHPILPINRYPFDGICSSKIHGTPVNNLCSFDHIDGGSHGNDTYLLFTNELVLR